MIVSLQEAIKIDEDIKEEDLEAIEIMIRNKTNNNFQNTRIRYKNITFIDDQTIGVSSKLVGLKVGDTIQINYSGYNDGLYVIKSTTDDTISFDLDSFAEIDLKGAMITKVEYPADIKKGVKDILRYDLDMKDKKGIKSESVSRKSVTYSDNDEGYPKEIVSFLNDYLKMRW